MNITEIRVKLMHNRTDRLRAFCSITIDDDFVVHDLRVIEGRKGLFVAMPSRKLTDNCPKCGSKNDLRSKFCSDCGQKLPEKRASAGAGRDKLHVDVAHPINTPCREDLQERVLAAYQEDEERAGAAEATVDEHEPDEGAGFDDYDEFEEEELAEGPEAEEAPIEEQVDVPELEGEPVEALPEEEGGEVDDLAPVLEVEPEPAAGPVSEEPPTEFGEVTPEGAPELPSETLAEAEPEEEEEEPEVEETPDGAIGRRRSSREDRKPGGFGEGIL